MVAVFQFMSDRHLYQLMAMKGSVEVIRGGETIIMDQTEVVPGDIVRLLVSRIVLVVSIAFIGQARKLKRVTPFF